MNRRVISFLMATTTSIFAQGMDSVWVSNSTFPPYSPTLSVQVEIGDTLNLRIGFSTQDSLDSFIVGLSYDTTKFEILDIGFDVVDANDGSPFQWWMFWEPLSNAISCATTVFDSICTAVWTGILIGGVSMFEIPPGNWMIGTVSLRAKQPGYTILLPSYLDTTVGFVLPYPCVVNIQVRITETSIPNLSQSVRVTYLKNHLIHIQVNELPLSHLTLKLYSPNGRIISTEEFLGVNRDLYIDLNSKLKLSGVYFAIIETQRERHILRLVYIR